MTANEAYRKGQEDMRRRCETLWTGWEIDGLVRHAKQTYWNKRASVALRIRHSLKAVDLAEVRK